MLKGFLLMLSLIVAIGAQNMFVIKQAILKNHIFAICTICFLCDAILMSFGIFGIGEILAKSKTISLIITILGIGFLIFYAIISLKSALTIKTSESIQVNRPLSLKKAILLTLAITLLNPHVYLDTVILVGANALSVDDKLGFFIGGASASLLWFYSLGFGVSKVSNILLNPNIYRYIEILTAIIMLILACNLCLFIRTLF